MLPMDQFKTLSETSRDGVCQIARLAVQGQEKMIALNIDAVQEFIEKSGLQIEQNWGEMAKIDPIEAWPQLLANNVKNGTAINLLLLGIGTRLHKDLTVATQAQLHAMQTGMLEEVNKYSSITRKLVAAVVPAPEHHGRKDRMAA